MPFNGTLAAIYRSTLGGIDPHPGTYHGTEFRSQFERKFAFKLDEWGEKWEYEPRRYWHGRRSYLPDFEILGLEHPSFIELKPTIRQIEAAKDRMSIIWETVPDALLVVACREGCWFHAAYRGRPWLVWQERWK